jgi:hypothetical protein
MFPSPSLGPPLLSGSPSPPFCWGMPVLGVATGAGAGGWAAGFGAGAGAAGAAGAGAGAGGAEAGAAGATGFAAGAKCFAAFDAARFVDLAAGRVGFFALAVRTTARCALAAGTAAVATRAARRVWVLEPPPTAVIATTTSATPTRASATNVTIRRRERELLSLLAVMSFTGSHRHHSASRCYQSHDHHRCAGECQRGGAARGATYGASGCG